MAVALGDSLLSFPAAAVSQTLQLFGCQREALAQSVRPPSLSSMRSAGATPEISGVRRPKPKDLERSLLIHKIIYQIYHFHDARHRRHGQDLKDWLQAVGGRPS